MKILFGITFLFFFLTVKGQELSTCQALESILKYEPAIKPYYFDKNTSYPIIFYDTTKFFKNCSIGEHYGRRVEVANVFPSAKILTPSDYVLIVEHKTKRILKIILSYKSSGAYCSFTLKRKKKEFKIIKFREMYL